MERGNQMQRQLDRWMGIPLVAVAGGVKRIRSLVPRTLPDPDEAQKIGLICLGAIGDLLLATSLINGLRQVLPHADLEILTSKANAQAQTLLPQEVRAASFRVKDIPGIVRHARSSRYDLLFDTGQWPRISALISAASGAGRTAGFSTPGQYRHFAYDKSVLHRNDQHEVENFLALGRAFFPSLTGEPSITLPEQPSAACPVLPDNGIVFCHMWPSGLKSALKEWPRAYWAELALSLLNAGYVPVFTGGTQDAGPTESFLAEYGLDKKGRGFQALSLAGKISLSDLAFYFRRAEAVISVNTGTMHLAAIAGAPTIGLHGPTNPLRWGPVGMKTVSLLPDSGRKAYLDLGFEYPRHAVPVLQGLPVSSVVQALRGFDLSI